MNEFIKKILLLFLVSCGGCYSTVFVYAQHDEGYRFDRSEPLFVYLGDDVSVSEVNFRAAVVRELSAAGVNVVSRLEDAHLVLTSKITEQRYFYQGYQYIPETYTSVDYIGGYPYYTTTMGYQPVPQIYSYSIDRARLRVFEASAFKRGKRIPVWEGTVELSPDRIHDSLRLLIRHLGENFAGRVRLEDESR